MKNTEAQFLKDKFKLLRWEVIKRVNPSQMVDFIKKFNYFCSEYKLRWEKCHRKEEVFLNNNKNWLDASISFVPPPTPLIKRGRKHLSFGECKENTKAKKCKELRENIPLPVLA